MMKNEVVVKKVGKILKTARSVGGSGGGRGGGCNIDKTQLSFEMVETGQRHTEANYKRQTTQLKTTNHD